MDINVQAFEVELGRGVSMSELAAHIVRASDEFLDNRYLYVAQNGEWWHGLLLTARDVKAFSRMRRVSGRVVMEPENLGDSELAHFNYFLLHERTQRGLFQYYHGSASLNGLGYQLRQKYGECRRQKIQAACRAAGASLDNPPQRIRRQYSGNLTYSTVLRRTTFAAMMQDMRRLKQVTLQFKEFCPNARAFRALSDRAVAVRHRLTFPNQNTGATIRDLVALVRSGDLKDLKGVGIGGDDLEKRFRLLNEPETLGKFDFREVVLNTAFDSGNVPQSLQDPPMIQRLHEIAAADPWCIGDDR